MTKLKNSPSLPTFLLPTSFLKFLATSPNSTSVGKVIVLIIASVHVNRMFRSLEWKEKEYSGGKKHNSSREIWR
jgi:hypothetical protein